MRFNSRSPAPSNRHTSTFVALAENTLKLTPLPSQVAPRGNGDPSVTRRSTFISSGGAGETGDLAALCLEGRHPLIDGGGRAIRVGAAVLEARDLKQIAELVVAELQQQMGEELAPRFLDLRFLQRAGLRRRQLTDAQL